jgi:hypothetical protein
LLFEPTVNNPLKSSACAEIGVSEISPSLATMFGNHRRGDLIKLDVCGLQQPSIKVNAIYLLKDFSICGCIRPVCRVIHPKIIMAWENT